MADKTVEQLSAMMDGEFSVAELDLALRRLAKDGALKSCWQRYHLISDALKNNIPEVVDATFAERVSKAIDADPAVPVNPIPISPTWYKPAAGFALAASVAVVGFLGYKLTQPNPDTTASPLASLSPALLPPPPTSNTTLQSKLNNYLVSHNEDASMNSVHGVLPYVRMVGYETDR